VTKETQKRPPVPQGQPAAKSSLRRIAALIGTIITVLLASFGYYHTQQKEIWDGRLNQVKEQLDIKNQELGKVKEDLRARAERESKQSPNLATLGQGGGTAEATLLKSQTVPVSHDLKITLTDISFEPNPPRYKVNARVVYDDQPEMQMRDATEGYTVTYPKEGGYMIELLKADSASAKFSIKKNP
jgi:hypothetical protein